MEDVELLTEDILSFLLTTNVAQHIFYVSYHYKLQMWVGDIQCTYNLILRRLRITTSAVEMK